MVHENSYDRCFCVIHKILLLFGYMTEPGLVGVCLQTTVICIIHCGFVVYYLFAMVYIAISFSNHMQNLRKMHMIHTSGLVRKLVVTFVGLVLYDVENKQMIKVNPVG